MINISNLHKKFNPGSVNEVYALKGIDLHIKEGEFITVIGTNGSGKSTLLNAISGTFFPDSGTIAVNGIDMSSKAEHTRAGYISRVFQDPFKGTAPEMTVAENIQIAILRGKRHLMKVGLNSKQIQNFISELQKMEMNLDTRLESIIGTLSGGQRQAISLLMAVIQKPKVLLLDEHTAALDPKSAAQVIKLTKKFIEKDNLTTLMITHSMQQALSLGNRLIMMHHGKIIDDINSEEKSRLTENDLLNKFEQIKKKEKLSTSLINEFRDEYA